MTPYSRRQCTSEVGEQNYLHQQHNCKNDEKQKPTHVWDIRLVRVLTCCPHSRNKKDRTHTGECDVQVCNHGRRGRVNNNRWPSQETLSKSNLRKNQLSGIVRVKCTTCFLKRFSSATTQVTAFVTTDMEPTRMKKQPMSAVQPVFAQSPWQKERLTHSQPREKPRHQKETQQSWMKLNIDIANSDSKPMSFSLFCNGRIRLNLNKKKKRRVGGTSRHKPCATSLSIGRNHLNETRIGQHAQWDRNQKFFRRDAKLLTTPSRKTQHRMQR